MSGSVANRLLTLQLSLGNPAHRVLTIQHTYRKRTDYFVQLPIFELS